MGGLNDLLGDEGLTCGHSQNLLAYLAGELLAYREEGISLAPEILFCESIERSLSSMPGAIHYKVGEGDLGAGLGKAILKACATLARHPWVIYIQRTSDTVLEYGVASFSYVPGSLTLADGITIASDVFSVLLKRVNDKTIKVIGSKGSINTFLFSTSRVEETDTDAVEKFADASTKGIYADLREDFGTYLKGTIESLLRGSHGCILACIPDASALAGIAALRDHIPLDPPLDLYGAFAAFKTGNSSEDLANLQATYGLAQGLFQSDGIVVFDRDGSVVAFRAFYRPQEKAEPPNVVGGARRRAYESAKELVGPFLSGLLFRSQDGLTLFHGSDE